MSFTEFCNQLLADVESIKQAVLQLSSQRDEWILKAKDLQQENNSLRAKLAKARELMWNWLDEFEAEPGTLSDQMDKYDRAIEAAGRE